MSLRRASLVAACTASIASVLSGCGGGGSPTPRPTPPHTPAPTPSDDCSPEQAQCSSCSEHVCKGCKPGYTMDASVKGSRCIAACIGQPPPQKPAKPSTPMELNGKAWPTTCINASTAHFFGIGDWGGKDGGQPGETWENPGKCVDRSGTGKNSCTDTDRWAQKYVATVMKKLAITAKPDYVVNVGDNFYPGGIDYACASQGANPPQDSGTYQWKHQFEDVYGPELIGLPWFSVLGNHDYGGRTYGQGWDQQIFSTWMRNDWTMPAQYWSTTVQYEDFAVEYFFLDSNKEDGSSDPNHGLCNGDAKCWDMTGDQSCMGALQKIWTDGLKMLEDGLSKSTAEWHIVVTHFPAEAYVKDEYFQTLNSKFGIDLIATGHAHWQKLGVGSQECQPSCSATTDDSSSIAWVVTGGGGGVTSDIPPTTTGKDDHSYGFTDFTIDRTTLKIDLYSWGGKSADLDIVATNTVQSHKSKSKSRAQKLQVDV